jgi:hypothetical protein
VDFLDGEGCIIVPKSVRPIIDYKESFFGTKKGAKKQFRHGNLHIRQFEKYYTVHTDKVDPAKDPLGHLLMDAPEYFVASIIGLKVAQQTACRGHHGRRDSHRMINDLSKSFQAGVAGAIFSYAIASIIKQLTGVSK